MTPAFRLTGIAHEQFEPLFRMSDAQLKAQGAERHFATESPGYPCRISLQDAEVGEELLLLPYLHQPAASPYRASGPIFVRRNAQRRTLAVNELPAYVTRRLMSVRAYDAEHRIVEADVCEGTLAAAEIQRFFAVEQVAYIQLHNARRGCFACQVDRA